MAKVNVPAPGGQFAGATTDRGRTPGGRFNGDGISGFVAQVLDDTILWIGTSPPVSTQYVLWINTEDGRWYGRWNDGDSTQWVDLSLPFGEGLPGPRGPQGQRGLTGPVGPGIPTGGAANEILVKVDGTDYNTAWGVRPADGLNVLNGSVAPTTEGVDGEFYIDTTAWDIYGPKTAGAWGSGTSLVGPTGATGPAGPGVAAGGSAGQKLEKIDGTDYNTQWVDVNEPPAGGTANQVLTKIDGTDYNYQWSTSQTVPAGGDGGTYFRKASPADYDTEWVHINTKSIYFTPTTLDTNSATKNTSSSAFATKGTVLTALNDMVIKSVTFQVSGAAPTQDVSLFICKLSGVGGADTITSILLDVGIVAYTNPADGQVFTIPDGGVEVVTGDVIGVCWVRTDGIGTDIMNTSFPTTGTQSDSNWTTSADAIRFASTAPVVSNAPIDTSSTASVDQLINYEIIRPFFPSGGTADQILVKQSGTDYDVAWESIYPVQDEISTTSYTLVAGDAGKWKYTSNASAVTITVDNSIFTAGDEIYIEQRGAGQITFAPGVGVTLDSVGGALKSGGQHGVVGIKCKTAATFVVLGDITV